MRKIVATGVVALFLDILSKQLVIHLMLENQSVSIISRFFYLTYVQNTGIAFSFLEGKVPFIIVMTVVVIFLVFQYIKDTDRCNLEDICYGMVIGGAVGNLVDRLVYGYVIDFLDVRILGYHFPIFNLADSFIVVGILILFVYSFKEGREKNGVNSRRKKEN